MPNHVTNRLHIIGDSKEVSACRKAIKTSSKENGKSYIKHVDFNKIIEMPKSLKITSGSNVDQAIAVLKKDYQYLYPYLEYGWVKELGITNVVELIEYFKTKLSKSDFSQARTAISNIKKYGCKDWYSWSTKNWGTKWNSYDSSYDKSNKSIKFDTAWATPYPVMEKLSILYPNLTFKVEYADEDMGSNCGSYELKNGVVLSHYEPKGYEAFVYACIVKGYTVNNEFGAELSYIQYCSFEDFQNAKERIMLKLQTPKDVQEVKDALKYNDHKDEILKEIHKSLIEQEKYELIPEILKNIGLKTE